MSYTLGQKFVSPVKDQEAEVIAIRTDGIWQITEAYKREEDLQRLLDKTRRDVVLFGKDEDYYDEDYITDDQLSNYDSWDGGIDWTSLVTEEEAAHRQEVSDKIVALLKAHDIDTSNLIVSDGKAYVGYDECESYIAGTGAWVPSSMQC